MRRWELEQTPPPATGIYSFVVRNPLGEEREITIVLSDEVVAQTKFRTAERIQPNSTFWICCAERRVADHLHKHADFPDSDCLRIEELNREDTLLAIRWKKR